MNTAINLEALIAALGDLRKRTGDKTLSHTIKAGRFRLVRVVYDNRGQSTVTPLSEWSTAEAHHALLKTFNG